jgi:hypothetical protein
MKAYTIDEFTVAPCIDTLQDVIDKKISLLYDFCILRHPKKKEADPREQSVRTALTKYGSKYRIDAKMRDVLIGDTPIETLLN